MSWQPDWYWCCRVVFLSLLALLLARGGSSCFDIVRVVGVVAATSSYILKGILMFFTEQSAGGSAARRLCSGFPWCMPTITFSFCRCRATFSSGRQAGDVLVRGNWAVALLRWRALSLLRRGLRERIDRGAAWATQTGVRRGLKAWRDWVSERALLRVDDRTTTSLPTKINISVL